VFDHLTSQTITIIQISTKKPG